jgi:hypothetical protein
VDRARKAPEHSKLNLDCDEQVKQAMDSFRVCALLANRPSAVFV